MCRRLCEVNLRNRTRHGLIKSNRIYFLYHNKLMKYKVGVKLNYGFLHVLYSQNFFEYFDN